MTWIYKRDEKRLGEKSRRRRISRNLNKESRITNTRERIKQLTRKRRGYDGHDMVENRYHTRLQIPSWKKGQTAQAYRADISKATFGYKRLEGGWKRKARAFG
jgi:hypothetical protein